MYVARLTLGHFRNHQALRLDAVPGLMVLVGANGVGKTNILEALSLLTPGRGLRGAAGTEMIGDGSDGLAVVAEIADAANLAPVTLGTAIRADAPGRRQVRINGADAPANRLSEWLSLVWLTPAMDRLFVDSASERRRFLDRMTLAAAPGHAQHVTRYEAAMRARTRLLTGDAPLDTHWLRALEAQMAEHGSALDSERHRIVAALDARLAVRDDPDFPAAALSLVDPDGFPAVPWTVDDLAHALERSRTRDAGAGRALTGPHRNDLAVAHRAKRQAAARCSTGEQKALLLGLVLAHAGLIAAQRGRPPLLLLDEVTAHLDPDRRRALFERLAATGGQAWLTGTEAALFAGVPAGAGCLRIEPGAASPCHEIENHPQ